MTPARLPAQRDAPVGGQAVLEGVMMRGVSTWAVAVRKESTGEIETQSFPLVKRSRRHPVLRWPVVRGVVALVESLGIGFKALESPPTRSSPRRRRRSPRRCGRGRS